ncbi:MAG: response regulator [Bacteroidota bacterium]
MTAQNPPSLPEVLLIEDDCDTVTILKIWLSDICRLIVANDGETALHILKDHQEKGSFFKLFLVDINLPVPWSGITLRAEIIENFKEYQFVPFIAETAFVMPRDQENIRNAGFTDCLFKPLDRLILLSMMEQYL